MDAVQGLRPTGGDPKTGFDLVQDQHHTVLGAQVAQTLQPHRGGRNAPRIANDGLQHHCSQLGATLSKQLLQSGAVIEADDVHQGPGVWGDASTKRDDLGGLGAGQVPVFNVGLPHHLVKQAMETALDHGDALAPGETARGAQGAHHSLGARVGKTHFVDLRTQGLDLLHHLGIELGGKTRDRATALDLRHHRRVHPLVAVTQDDGAIAQAKVNELFAIDIGDATALGAFQKNRLFLAPIAVVFRHALGHVHMGLAHQCGLIGFIHCGPLQWVKT